MTDLGGDEIEAEAQALVERMGKPVRRVRPRLARQLQDGEDLEVATPAGGVMAWRLGPGPGTLLVHGWEDDNALWSPLIDANAQMLRASVAFDLPGHGWSPAEACSMEGAGQAVLAVADAFGPIDSVVGHSFGCGAVIWALAHGLDVPRAVLIASPVPRQTARGWDLNDWKKHQVERGENPIVIDRAMAIMAERPPRNDRDYAVEDVLPALGATKALIIHSMDDEQCPVGNSQRMAELWPGSELLLLDGLGHRLIAQDDDVIANITAFVES